MTTIKKRIATFIGALLLSSSVGTATVLASQCYYEFSLTYSVNNGVDFSDPNPKDDNEQTAYIYTTSGNIIPDDEMYMSVYKIPSYSELNRVSGWRRIWSNNGQYTSDYFSSQYRAQGSFNYLCGDTDRYDVYVFGYWFS